MSLRIPAICCIALLALLSGCAKAPNDKIDAARSEIDNARKMMADTYAPSDFAAAEVSFEEAMKIVGAQNRKFALLRNYDKAAIALDKAISSANAAIQISKTEKEKAKIERLRQEELKKKPKKASTKRK